MDEVMDDVAAAAVEMVEDGVGAATASVEEEFDSFVKGKMEELVAAKAEYQELLGGEKPSFAELQDFVKLKKKVASEGRSKFKMADPDAPKEPFKPPSITCYPYSDWGDRPSVIVCPPTAMCPGYFSCPVRVGGSARTRRAPPCALSRTHAIYTVLARSESRSHVPPALLRPHRIHDPHCTRSGRTDQGQVLLSAHDNPGDRPMRHESRPPRWLP